MTDLYPGMTIEVSTAFTVLPSASDRPEWLDPAAMWPPQPGQVMYMIKERSLGICDKCILTCQGEISGYTSHGEKVEERGSSSWYCSCHPAGGCRRWWNGSRYDSSVD